MSSPAERTMTLAQMPPLAVARPTGSRAPADMRTPDHELASLTVLRPGSWPIEVPAHRTLVSYVLRHSASGMSVRSSGGQQCRLEAGAMLVCNGPDLVVHRGAKQRGTDCLAFDLLLSGVRNRGVFVHLDDYYPTFVNSPQGCIRLLVGAWNGHRALLAPADGFWMLDVDVAPGEALCIPVSSSGAVGLLTSGSLVVDGRTMDDAAPQMLAPDGDAIVLASETGASLLLFPPGTGARPPIALTGPRRRA